MDETLFKSNEEVTSASLFSGASERKTPKYVEMRTVGAPFRHANELAMLPPGQYEIDTFRVFFEHLHGIIHRRYPDILSGETFACAPRAEPSWLSR